MTTMQYENFVSNWKEIVSGFLQLGVTAYGGPAIMGLMQAELQEKRQWVPKERFVEGLSLVNMLPGATATPYSSAHWRAQTHTCWCGCGRVVEPPVAASWRKGSSLIRAVAPRRRHATQ